jgi:hypothetical protein
MIACEKVTVKINAQCLLSRISETITLSFWVCLPFVSSHAHYAQARPPATGDRHLSAEIANATEGPVHNNLLNDAEGPDAEGPVHNNLLSDAEHRPLGFPSVVDKFCSTWCLTDCVPFFTYGVK